MPVARCALAKGHVEPKPCLTSPPGSDPGLVWTRRRYSAVLVSRTLARLRSRLSLARTCGAETSTSSRSSD